MSFITLKDDSIAHDAHLTRATTNRTRGAEDMMSLKSEICEYGNPFLETSSDVLVLERRDIVETSVMDNVHRIDSLGCQEYNHLCMNG